MRWAGYVACMVEKGNACWVFGGKREGNRLDFKETGWDGMDSINLAHGRDSWRAVVNTVNLSGSITCNDLLDYLTYY